MWGRHRAGPAARSGLLTAPAALSGSLTDPPPKEMPCDMSHAVLFLKSRPFSRGRFLHAAPPLGTSDLRTYGMRVGLEHPPSPLYRVPLAETDSWHLHRTVRAATDKRMTGQ
jgi:hypothetical protein